MLLTLVVFLAHSFVLDFVAAADSVVLARLAGVADELETAGESVTADADASPLCASASVSVACATALPLPGMKRLKNMQPAPVPR
ncbi:hypothetical protein [Hyphomicrobium sp. D-2]|uniref:hypothetical protein n=1 Tax=Hyphomicrobium sp. D-2 TaxID=3041621 RepID=UPI002458F1D9|nr:hypothetical protein [Hyphomicrobium sp. D-2]MDH4983190.1 hypothetical protein [Hyphomicrobium sp. D-2]